MALNKVMLIGNVGKDPEVRYLETPEHPKVAQFTLATTERYKAKDGSVTEQTEWHNIVAWRGLGIKDNRLTNITSQMSLALKKSARRAEKSATMKRNTQGGIVPIG